MKNLILLDNQKVSFDILNSLLSENYKMFQAVTSQQLYSVLDEHPLSMLLVNVDMPNNAAINMVTALRNTTKMTSGTPAFFMVSETRPDVLQKITDLDSVEIVKKPFDPIIFLDRLRTAFNTTEETRDKVTGLYKKIYFTGMVCDMFAEGKNGYIFLMQIDSSSMITSHVDIATLRKCIRIITRTMPDTTLMGIDGPTILGFVPEITEQIEIKFSMENLVEHLKLQMECSGVKVYSSVGLAIHTKAQQTFKELYGIADKAMKLSRQNGKNCVYFYHSLR